MATIRLSGISGSHPSWKGIACAGGVSEVQAPASAANRGQRGSHLLPVSRGREFRTTWSCWLLRHAVLIPRRNFRSSCVLSLSEGRSSVSIAKGIFATTCHYLSQRCRSRGQFRPGSSTTRTPTHATPSLANLAADQQFRSTRRTSHDAITKASRIGTPNQRRFRPAPRVSIPHVHCCTVPFISEGRSSLPASVASKLPATLAP